MQRRRKAWSQISGLKWKSPDLTKDRLRLIAKATFYTVVIGIYQIVYKMALIGGYQLIVITKGPPLDLWRVPRMIQAYLKRVPKSAQQILVLPEWVWEALGLDTSNLAEDSC